MDGWKSWKRAENSFLAAWYQRVRESYVAIWFFGVFQNSRMSTSTATGGGGGGGGVGGALTLMGCVREASPPPQNHHQQQQHRTLGLGEFSAQNSVDPLPKEPKKRRFHPLRGLRKIFRRKSRGAADARIVASNVDRDTSELARLPREDITDRHPAGRPEEARSRSASELLTDSCDRESVFLRRPGMEESYVKLRGGAGKLSVSHDSVFPGEVPHTRPLSSLARLATLEERFTDFEHQEKNAEENQPKNSKSPKDTVDRVIPVAKEDLPQLESASLNHTAALHRISVRPKNRRPPKRSVPQAANTSTSTITTITENSLDSLDQQAVSVNSNTSSPTESKNVSIMRKSSSRLSRTSDIFEELESKLPRKPPSMVSLSPDSLDAVSASRTSIEGNEEQPEIRSVVRKPSNRIPKGSEIFEELEAKLPRRRSSNRLSKSPDSLESSSCWFSKSSEGFDKLTEFEEAKPVVRRLLNPISKSSDRVSKSSDSLEVIEALASDESIERRRSSFEFGARRSSKNISKSSESFDILEQTQDATETVQELQKRSSISDINLARGRKLSKNMSKSSESFEWIEVGELKDQEENIRDSFGKCCRRSSKRMSSESSDNLELDDKLENRRIRRTPKRIPSTSFVDIVPADDQEEEKRPFPVRKPSRLQKSSESSELGSTDTLDSERRNKSSESTETLDSLERDLDQEKKEDLVDGVTDKREKNDSWVNKHMVTTDSSEQISVADATEDSKSLTPPDKFYWRQSSESKENIDIHQLLAITIVTRMADNGNNQRSSVIYPKKKQNNTSSQPTSPVAKQEDNKMLFDNLLVSKNDEDLQNMLNGNISEVSTDTKSFKEKLIMFEKLGK
ncbi:uncharacterized protein LOC143180248 isoform X5 [Calliopsis andreniformis]|uniref:uncharacterized protein LOC143180248 isoform X5 n=1 Tax=Calliopsis andreniformis TaxID=337506 RepID=UPI003FCED586